ncbi:NAD(P)/FAD-dependent oxidoreductase [Cellulosimicrobium sp. CUA-896]|uniref:phytoene desaturase family protein n=1 Tax=Cellulosimicrobium sp. CUA-896 TaxID=1517881 RepID=UPI001C9E4E73|nr:NAD(P)/FAD-dependent oxidoreductase [Cellulosimicrobium sp. CUA-896]
MRTVDAVVIGAGPNGLVAANALVDAGWDVLVLEEQDTPGGAVRTAEVAAPGYRTDLFSAFYPLAAASPVVRGLHLEQHGLEWTHAPSVVAHALDDGRTAVLHRDAADTAAGLEEFGAGDGDAWLRLVEDWDRIRDPFLDALFSPLPPLVPAVRLLRRLGVGGSLDLARLATLPVRRFSDETFRGEGGPLLLTGNAMHADVPPDAGAAASSAGCSSCSGRTSGSPSPWAVPGRSPTRSSPASARAAGRSSPGRGSTTCTSPAAGPSACAPPPASTCGHDARSSPTSSPPPSTATWSASTACRRGSCATSTASSGTTRRSSSTGRSTARCRGRPRARTAPGPCTSASTVPGSSTSPPTCPRARSPAGRSSCSAR